MTGVPDDVVLRRAPAVLLDSSSGGFSKLYAAPRRILAARKPEEVIPKLKELEQALADGFHAAGFLAYEAAAAFEPRLSGIADAIAPEPLLWFGLFETFTVLTPSETAALIERNMGGTRRSCALSQPRLSVSDAEYISRIETALGHLAAGDAYQVNLTADFLTTAMGDPLALYARMRMAQPVSYGAYIDTGSEYILSASPELFLKRRGDSLTARPMKGTLARGLDAAGDAAAREALANDPKSQAENLMIVDLLRNDLSKIAVPGSVSVPELFRVETYPALLQMVSTVTAELKPGMSIPDIAAALFPCGSVTGAPKIRAMEIIHALEKRPRGVYTGAIGAFSPDGDFTFNVPIRTLALRRDGEGRLGAGGGIVADSDPESELAECRLKARFLTDGVPPFDLIETLLLKDGEYPKRAGHLARLASSSSYFGFHCDIETIISELDALASLVSGTHRVRLLLSRSGAVSLTASPQPPPPKTARVALAAERIFSADPFRRHKTTHRPLYEAAQQAARAHDFLDFLFLNERGELAEGAIGNLFLERGGVLLTPPLSSGALPGVLRAELLASGRAAETVLTPEDIEMGILHTGNALRGLIPVKLEKDFIPQIVR